MKGKIVPESAEELVGNTIPIPAKKETKKQVNKAKCWCFVFNNYEADDINILVPVLNEFCVKYIFEEEVGEQGTKHLQGWIELKEKRRPTELNLNKKIHWELAKGTEKENIVYCSKDYRQRKTLNIYKTDNIKIPRELKLINPDRAYQKEIIDIIKNEPNERQIFWYYDSIGNVGKSQFSKYLVVKYNAIYVDEGKKADLMNTCLTEHNKGNELDLVVLDIPRDNKNNCSYKSIESIKSGLIYSPKYEGGYCVFNSPHIIIFSNYYPDIKKLSADRWEIYQIQPDFTTKKMPVSEDFIEF